ncbi:hypothetical protein FBU59_006529 [Linderina macrospora]|uniref:Uncharacterized protein n=1 Tax=Linderina macrospora TaxID=4868 RepID=A0ACC1IZM3_9FUNG|nr:hypothetical protein FBU59_006529 [Linderina macrospora]
MLRDFLFPIIITLLGLQTLLSAVQIGFYATDRIQYGRHSLRYITDWRTYYRWAVLGSSLAIAFILMVASRRAPCGNDPYRKGWRRGRKYPAVVTVLSFLWTALWIVLAALQAFDHRQADYRKSHADAEDGSDFVFPLGQGFSLQNRCSLFPYTKVERGTTNCRLLRIESVLDIVAVTVWGLTFVSAVVLFFNKRRKNAPSIDETVAADF